jgi:hypothetical protein
MIAGWGARLNERRLIFWRFCRKLGNKGQADA